MKKTFQTTISMLLVVLLLALSGLAVAGWSRNANANEVLQSGGVQGGASGQQSGSTSGSNVPSQVVQSPPAQAPPQGGLIDARTAVRRTGPAVVTVINQLVTGSQINPLGDAGQAPSASGSGVVIDQRGYIVTNNHVIVGQKSLQVIFSDGKKVSAQLVGGDPFTDLAVLKVNTTSTSVAQFGDSDKLEPGQPVVAIGSALGDFRNTVTAGVVSALHRDLNDPQSPALRDLIQTDAAINNGNSGGPLLDLEGNVVGINVAVVRGTGTNTAVAEGLGFAIPAKTARAVVDQLIAKGAVDRPFIGISYQPITPQIAAYYNLPVESGILVSDVTANGPAAKAGIKPNSIITKFDGVALTSTTSLLEVLMKRKVGDTVKLTVLAPGSTTETEVSVTLSSRPSGQ